MGLSFLRKIKIEEWVALGASFLVSAINILFYQNDVSPKETLFLMLRYFTFDYPFYGLFFLFIYLTYLWKFYLRLAFLVSARLLDNIPFPKRSAKELLGYFFDPLRLLAPLVIIAIPFYALLGNLNYQLRFSGKDLLFLELDKALFGVIPFLYLPTKLSSFFFTIFFQYAYFSLAAVMNVTLALLFLLNRELLFRKALLSFFISLIIGFPIFPLFPCQDPNSYFLRNLRSNVFPQEIKETLHTYRPSLITKDAIERIGRSETDTAHDNSVPISCFPSMHAVWAFFVAYFLAKVRNYSLLLTVPWTLFLLLGGVYLAQHYVVDYIMAVPVAVLSLILAKAVLRLEG